MGGLLPIVSKNTDGLVDKSTGFYKQESYSGDLNQLGPGYARCVLCTNTPVENFYGVVYSIMWGSGIIIQHANSAGTNEVYERVFWEKWNPWIKLG